MQTLEVFLVFLKLGFTSFGGPIAHLAYFHKEFVARRKWISDPAYADLVSLCQFLPGPASSQVGMAIGISRAGYAGAIAAWLGFTLPSAIILVLVGFGISNFDDYAKNGVLHGLKIAAVAVVAQALLAMGEKLCPDKQRATLAVAGAIIVAIISSAVGGIAAIAFGALFGWLFLKHAANLPHEPIHTKLSKGVAVISLVSFFLLLFFLPVLVSLSSSQALKLFDSFFRVGSLVFGGGHVVLPLLQAEVVQTGWVSSNAFMAGYGATQAIPGPLFAFSAYLGAVSNFGPTGWIGASICLLAVFLPTFLLVFGVLPFWEQLRKLSSIRSAMMGVNAVVVGLLLAAFYNPVWSSAIFSINDFCLATIAFLLLVFWKTPSWVAVILCVAISGLAA